MKHEDQGLTRGNVAATHVSNGWMKLGQSYTHKNAPNKGGSLLFAGSLLAAGAARGRNGMILTCSCRARVPKLASRSPVQMPSRLKTLFGSR